MSTPRRLRAPLMPPQDHLRLRMDVYLDEEPRRREKKYIDVILRDATRRTRSRRVSLSTRARILDMYAPSLSSFSPFSPSFTFSYSLIFAIFLSCLACHFANEPGSSAHTNAPPARNPTSAIPTSPHMRARTFPHLRVRSHAPSQDATNAFGHSST